jgi:hypothetical protein
MGGGATRTGCCAKENIGVRAENRESNATTMRYSVKVERQTLSDMSYPVPNPQEARTS